MGLDILARLFALLAATVMAAAPATAAGRSTAAERAVLDSDAAWAAAANTGNVDAWMAFCATDAIVLLPHEALASGVVGVRDAVAHFMGAGHGAVHWHATAVEVAPGGDLAQVLGSFDMEHTGAVGGSAPEQGTRLALWRKQPDGSWKAIVDSWTVATGADNPAPGARAAAPVPSPGPALSPPPPAATVSPPAPVPGMASRYGDAPVHYLESIRRYFQEYLKDPESLQYGEISRPEQGSMKGTAGAFLMSESIDYGWIVRAEVNARNAAGRYVGFKKYQFLFRGEKLLRAAAPLPEGETR